MGEGERRERRTKLGRGVRTGGRDVYIQAGSKSCLQGILGMLLNLHGNL